MIRHVLNFEEIQRNVDQAMGLMQRHSPMTSLLASTFPLQMPSALRTVATTCEILHQLLPDYTATLQSIHVVVLGATRSTEMMAEGLIWEAMPALLGFTGPIHVSLVGLEGSSYEYSELRDLSTHLHEEIMRVVKPSGQVSVSWHGEGAQAFVANFQGKIDLCVWACPGLGEKSWAGVPMHPFERVPTAVMSLSICDALDDVASCQEALTPFPMINDAKLVPFLGEPTGGPGSFWFIPNKGSVAGKSMFDLDQVSDTYLRPGMTPGMMLMMGSVGLRGRVGDVQDLEIGNFGLCMRYGTGELGYLDDQGRFVALAVRSKPDRRGAGNGTQLLMQRKLGWIDDREAMLGLLASHRQQLVDSAALIAKAFCPLWNINGVRFWLGGAHGAPGHDQASQQTGVDLVAGCA